MDDKDDVDELLLPGPKIQRKMNVHANKKSCNIKMCKPLLAAEQKTHKPYIWCCIRILGFAAKCLYFRLNLYEYGSSL